MSRKIVTITGGSGFVGQLLRRGLQRRGYRVRVFDTLRGPFINILRRKYLGNVNHPRLVRSFSKRVNRSLRSLERVLIAGRVICPTWDDILDVRSRIAARFRDSYAVIHLAAFPHPNVPGVNEADFERLNFDGAVNVFQAAKDAGAAQVCFCFFGTSVSDQQFSAGRPISDSGIELLSDIGRGPDLLRIPEIAIRRVPGLGLP